MSTSISDPKFRDFFIGFDISLCDHKNINNHSPKSDTNAIFVRFFSTTTGIPENQALIFQHVAKILLNGSFPQGARPHELPDTPKHFWAPK